MRSFLSTLMLLGGFFGLSSCSLRILHVDLGQPDATVSTITLPAIEVSVASVYPAQGAQWNSYIKFDDGAQNAYHQSDDACDGTETGRWGALNGCIHGGEKLKVAVTGQSTCAGLTVTDQLGVFDWVCSVEAGVATFFTSGLKSDKGLRDLITATPALDWIENKVTVMSGSTEVAHSTLAKWWDNEIEPLPANVATAQITLDGVDDDGIGPDDAYDPRTILALDVSRSTKGYLLGDGFGLVTLGSAELSANAPDICMLGEPCMIGFSGSKFAWAEAAVDATGTNHSFQSNNAAHFVIRGSTGRNGNWEGAWLEGSSSGLIANSTLSDNGNSGLYMGWAAGVVNMTIQDLTLTNNTNESFHMDSNSTGNHVSRIVASNNGGWGSFTVTDSDDNHFSDVTLIDGGSTVTLLVDDLDGSTFDNFNISGPTNNSWCVFISNVTNSVFSRFNIQPCANPSTEGVRVTDSDDNKFYSWRCVNTIGCIWLFNGTEDRNVIHDATAINNSQTAFIQEGVDNTFTRITSIGSGTGIWAPGGAGSRMTYAHLTLGNSTDYGIRGLDGTLVNALAINNGSSGLYFDIAGVTGSRVANVASAYNGFEGITFGSDDAWIFSGNLLTFANSFRACGVYSAAPIPGLHHTTCTQSGADGSNDYGAHLSTAVLRSSRDPAASIVGKIDVDDSSNASDTLGLGVFAAITDWLSFAYPLRGYALDGSAFPNADHQGQCVGGSCRIWDFRLSSADSVLRNTIGDGLSQNAPFVAGAACPAAVHGNQAMTDDQTAPNTFLLAAFEIVQDSIGDDDGLCESNEACIYAPNFGAYQGEGDYLAAGSCTFANGAVSGVTMYAYPVNGGTKL